MSRNKSGKAGGSATNKGAKAAPRPNLPAHHLPPPYSKLMNLGYGDFPEVYEETAAALLQADPRAAAKRLLEMVQDESYYDYDGDDYPGGEGGDARGWTRLHAVRALGRMGEAGQIGIEPLLSLLDTEDDYLREDMPFYFAAVGPAAVEPLARTLTNTDSPSYRRSGAGESLAEIGEKHPELRTKIVRILEQTLTAEREDTALTGFLIINLCDLAAKEAMPAIEAAYNGDRVDETLVSLAEVQEHFGLPITAERPRWDYGPGEPRRAGPHTETHPEAAAPDPAHTPYVAEDKIGRNEPCPCGSGKKYKKCCGA